MIWVLRLVEELATVPVQYLKKLRGTEDLWEIRAQQGGNAFRILGFFEPSRVLVLTHGFAKKRQKIPSRELEVAESRRREYLKRRARHE